MKVNIFFHQINNKKTLNKYTLIKILEGVTFTFVERNSILASR